MSLVRHSTFCSLFLLLIVKGITGSLLRTRLRHVDPYYDDFLFNSDEERIIVIAFVDDDTNSIDAYKNLILRTNENEKPTVELKSQIPLTDTLQGEPQKKQDKGDFDGLKLTKQQKSMLRKKWRASCDRKAAKTCRKACKMAASNVCRSYHCKKSLRRRFKKECKESCKSKFVGSKSSDTGSDSD